MSDMLPSLSLSPPLRQCCPIFSHPGLLKKSLRGQGPSQDFKIRDCVGTQQTFLQWNGGKHEKFVTFFLSNNDFPSRKVLTMRKGKNTWKISAISVRITDWYLFDNKVLCLILLISWAGHISSSGGPAGWTALIYANTTLAKNKHLRTPSIQMSHGNKEINSSEFSLRWSNRQFITHVRCWHHQSFIRYIPTLHQSLTAKSVAEVAIDRRKW